MVKTFRTWRNIPGVTGLHLNHALRGKNGKTLYGPDGEHLKPDVQMWYKGKLHIFERVNTNPIGNKSERYSMLLEHNGIARSSWKLHAY